MRLRQCTRGIYGFFFMDGFLKKIYKFVEFYYLYNPLSQRSFGPLPSPPILSGKKIPDNIEKKYK
jgi:hypothetical protein